MCEICKSLNGSNSMDLQRIWTIFEYSTTKQSHLLRDRHLDQMLMCAIYVYWRNRDSAKILFKDIMVAYRKQPQATSDVYRDVHMSKKGKFVYFALKKNIFYLHTVLFSDMKNYNPTGK